MDKFDKVLGFIGSVLLVVGIVFVGGGFIWQSYATHTSLNYNPQCVIERIDREVVQADGKVSMSQIAWECWKEKD